MVKIITLEGIDYAGKTTALVELSKKYGKDICFNEGVIYPANLTARLLSIANQATESEKEFLYTSMMMMDKIESEIRHSEDSRVFIQDRYWPSVVAYGRFLNKSDSIHNHENYFHLFLQPQAVILLDCSDKEIVRRSKTRNRKSIIDKILLSDPAEIKGLRKEIEKSVENLPNIFLINTTNKPIEEVSEEIIKYLKKKDFIV